MKKNGDAEKLNNLLKVWTWWGWAFGLAVKMLIQTLASHIGEPGFES